jgi:hypothetical protein
MRQVSLCKTKFFFDENDKVVNQEIELVEIL